MHPKDATYRASIPYWGCGWQVGFVVTELSSAKADVFSLQSSEKQYVVENFDRMNQPQD